VIYTERGFFGREVFRICADNLTLLIFHMAKLDMCPYNVHSVQSIYNIILQFCLYGAAVQHSYVLWQRGIRTATRAWLYWPCSVVLWWCPPAYCITTYMNEVSTSEQPSTCRVPAVVRRLYPIQHQA